MEFNDNGIWGKEGMEAGEEGGGGAYDTSQCDYVADVPLGFC